MIIPLSCRTLLLALVISVLGFQPLKAQQPASLSGTWYGELNLVVQKLRIGMKIASTPEGAFKGTLDSIDQSAFGIPLTLVKREEDKVRIEIESLGVVFNATLSAAGQQLSGTFTQNGIPLPLKLRRVDRYPSLNRPQEPQPPFPYDEEEVVYRNELHDVTLAGTLTLPRTDHPLAAVLLITGSGSPGPATPVAPQAGAGDSHRSHRAHNGAARGMIRAGHE